MSCLQGTHDDAQVFFSCFDAVTVQKIPSNMFSFAFANSELGLHYGESRLHYFDLCYRTVARLVC